MGVRDRWNRVARMTVVAAAAWGLLGLPAVSLAQGTGDNPVGAWQQRLAQAEAQVRRLPAGDTSALRAASEALSTLHVEIASWLATFPPAQQDVRPWLEAAGDPLGTVEAAADEISRLRAVLSRIAAARQPGGGGGAFYLGRMDVAVTADAGLTATAAMPPAGAVVLEAKEIAAHGQVALSGALALAPGVSFARVGQRNETTIYVRGFDNRQVPVFVDGIPVYTPYDGYADLERFTTFDIAELQVSKGFTSVIYGANTLGGAINVVSRRPATRLEGAAGFFAGTGESANGYVNLGTRAASWYVQGGASYLTADHVRMSADFAPAKYEDGGARENSYRHDGKFNVKFGFTPGATSEYAISYVGQRGEKGNPPYAGSDASVRVRYWQWPYWDRDSVYLVSNTNLGKAGYLRGRAYYDEYRNLLNSYDDATHTTQVKASSFSSPYHDYTFGGSAEWGTSIGGRQSLRTVFHLKQDNHEEHNTTEPVRRQQGWISSVGAEDSLVVSPRVSVVAGVGFDWQTTTTAQGFQQGAVVDLPTGTTSGLNPQIGVFWSVASGMLRATVSGKTRLPSMKDRYSYKFGTQVPNPDLKPEHSTTYEAGYQGALGGRTTFQASVFYSRIDDLIQRVIIAPNVQQQQNVGLASAAGFEADVRTRPWQGLELAGNYTFLDRDNISAPSVPLTETPRHKGLVSATVGPWYRLRGMFSVDFEAGRETMNEAGHYFDVPSFAVLSAKVSWNVAGRLNVDLSGLNLTDRNYWIVDGYPESGRVVRLSASYRF
jgi:iron complex outermembrane receptor protein